MLTNLSVLKKIETEVSHIELRSDGVVKISMKDHVEVDLAQSREVFDAISSFATKKELLVLVIGGTDNSITKEAREFAGSDEASSVTIAEAIITTSLSQKLIVNFLLHFYKPKREIKFFTHEDDALNWLYQFKENVKFKVK